MIRTQVLRSIPTMPVLGSITRGFYGNRFASVSDFATEEWKQQWDKMESFSQKFIELWTSEDIHLYTRWNFDPLHTRFRCWEYPYVSNALRRWCPTERRDTSAYPLVLDIGTGTTFFPYFVCTQGYNFIATDVNETFSVLYNNLGRRACEVGLVKEPPQFKIMDARKLEFPDESFDAVVSISVLEHLSEGIEQVVREVQRVLKPGGIFIVTFDVMYSGHTGKIDNPPDTEPFYELLNVIESNFDLPEKEKVRHPRDLLLWNTAPIELYQENVDSMLRPKAGLRKYIWPIARLIRTIVRMPMYLKGKVIKSPRSSQDMWAVYGGTFKKNVLAGREA